MLKSASSAVSMGQENSPVGGHKTYSFAVFNVTVWVFFYGLVRIAQTLVFTKPVEYLLIDLSDTAVGFALCFAVRPILQPYVSRTSLRTVLVVMGCAMLSAIAWAVVHESVYSWVFPNQPPAALGLAFLKGLTMPFYVFVLWCWAFAFWLNQIWRIREQQRRVEAELAMQRTQMRALQNQLAPHFLFNAMNAVYADAMAEGAQRTQDSLLRLSNLLRYVAQPVDDGLVALGRELEFAQDYVAIEQRRFRDRLSFNARSTVSDEAVLVPKMLLQPILENVVHHVVQATSTSVRIDLTVSTEGGALVFVAANSIPKDLEESPSAGLGSGLDSLRERLALIYGAGAELSIDRSATSFSVRVRIPL